jgi:hypothetical protein
MAKTKRPTTPHICHTLMELCAETEMMIVLLGATLSPVPGGKGWIASVGGVSKQASRPREALFALMQHVRGIEVRCAGCNDTRAAKSPVHEVAHAV